MCSSIRFNLHLLLYTFAEILFTFGIVLIINIPFSESKFQDLLKNLCGLGKCSIVPPMCIMSNFLSPKSNPLQKSPHQTFQSNLAMPVKNHHLLNQHQENLNFYFENFYIFWLIP